jgi:hypothetical protein
MRTCALPMLALVPFMTLDEDPSPVAQVPCSIALEVQVRAPLVWGTVQWQILIGEVTRIWAPYGVSFCWDTDGEGCRGFEVKVRVLLADDPPPPVSTSADPLLGWIWFHDHTPGSDIVMSVKGVRDLVSLATMGGRPLAAWSPALVDRQMPRAIGRALAHEIGHLVLRDRAHATRGLMASSFTPYQLTFAPRSAFRLGDAPTASVQGTCAARGIRAQRTGGWFGRDAQAVR